MTDSEMHQVLSYFAADHGVVVTDEKRKLWLAQFAHVDFATGVAAATLLLSRKTFGFPKCHEFHEALREVMCAREELMPWGEAWDLWVEIARRHSYYRGESAVELYKQKCPLGHRALGTMAREYFSLGIEQMPTMRAQFRQRYETLQSSVQQHKTISPAAMSDIRRLRAGKQPKHLGVSNVVGRLAQKLGRSK